MEFAFSCRNSGSSADEHCSLRRTHSARDLLGSPPAASVISLAELRSLSPDERAALLDVGQFALDLVGVVEPTPVADITNAVISLTRDDLTGAAIRAAGVVPYIGDTAKLANVARYSRVVDQAIVLARTNAPLAHVLKPVLNSLVRAIDAIPASLLTRPALLELETLRTRVVAFLGPARRLVGIELVTEKMLLHVLGSTANIGALPRRNMRLVAEFFVRKGIIVGDNITHAAKLARGIDLHAVEPISVASFRAGDRFWQYGDTLAEKLGENAGKLVSVKTASAADKKIMIGQWFVRTGGSVRAADLGLSSVGRELREFVLMADCEVLVSRSSRTVDYWTRGGLRQAKSPLSPHRAGEFTAGGSEQLFLPRAWEVMQFSPAGGR